jgi:RND family efflux transporter MFP subunit
VALVALTGCPREREEAKTSAPIVRVITTVEEPLQERTPVAGVLTPLPGRDVKVGALVSGRVDRVFVGEGERVRAGQPLAHVEAGPLRDRLSETQAQRDQARAQLENARTRRERTERLWKDGISSRQEVDDARAAEVAAESAVRQATAVGGTATVQLDRATLRAPFAGVVAGILVPAGQPVEGNGVPVVEVADPSELDLRAPIAAGKVGAVRLGQRAELTVDGVGAFGGAVEAIAPLVDTVTNTVTVRVRVANGDGRLRAGQFARGALLGAEHQGIAVPASAVLPGASGAADTVALLLSDSTVGHRAVVLGAEVGDRLEVRSGLKAGERVIVAGGYALPDGTKVEVAP